MVKLGINNFHLTSDEKKFRNRDKEKTTRFTERWYDSYLANLFKNYFGLKNIDKDDSQVRNGYLLFDSLICGILDNFLPQNYSKENDYRNRIEEEE